MWRKGADRLGVHAGEPAVGRDDDLDRGIVLQGDLVGQREVRPRDDDGRLARHHQSLLGDDRDEVAGFLQLLEEVEAGLGIVERATVGEGGRVDRLDGLVRGRRVAGQGDRVLVVGLEEVGPVLRDGLDDLGVDLEREDTVVVAVPGPVSVLDRRIDRVPRRNLVVHEQAVGLGLRAERDPDVDDVRGLRTLVRLIGLDRLDLVAGPAVRVQLVELDSALLDEAVEHGAVVAPVVRQGDRGQVGLGVGAAATGGGPKDDGRESR